MSEREKWIERVYRDLQDVIHGIDQVMKEENPKWRIVKCNISGSLGKHLKGKTELFKTPHKGISGAEERGEKTPAGYLSDVDVVCNVTEETDMWHKGNIVMEAENRMEKNPENYLPRSRSGSCTNFRGDKIESKACNDPFYLPLDEPDLRKTHEVVLHLRKPGMRKPFEAQFEWKPRKAEK